MATARKRGRGYSIRVYCGLDMNARRIDKKEIRQFLNTIYLYASTYLSNIHINSTSIISRIDSYDNRIRKLAMWNAFEPYIRAIFEKIREKYTGQIEKLAEDEINKMISELEIFRKEAENEVNRFDIMREDEQLTPDELKEDIEWEKEHRNDY